MKVSNELIEVVLNIEIADIIDNVVFKESTKELKYYFVDSDGYYEPEIMNIYEFAFKCKEWIISKGYYLSTFIDFGVDTYFCIIKWFNSENIIQNKKFIADTEFEAIIKACEWLLSKENK